MHTRFSEFYGPTHDEVDSLWKEGLVVVDTSSLLNLYTLPDLARNEILEILRLFRKEERLWIPNQVGLEFHRNRAKVALRHKESLSRLKQDVGSLKSTLKKSAKHLPNHASLLESLEQIAGSIDETISRHTASGHTDPLIQHDKILKELDCIFDSSTTVGEPLTEESLQALYERGRARYAVNTPPGFSDDHKGFPGKFGDLVVWEQLIQHAAGMSRHVLFVSDDTKDDWMMNSGSTNNPMTHPQLRSEFSTRTGKIFCLYTTDRFLSEARTRLNANVSDETIETAREIPSNENHEDLTPSQMMALGFLIKGLYNLGEKQSFYSTDIATALASQMHSIDYQRMAENMGKIEATVFDAVSNIPNNIGAGLSSSQPLDVSEENIGEHESIHENVD